MVESLFTILLQLLLTQLVNICGSYNSRVKRHYSRCRVNGQFNKCAISKRLNDKMTID